MGLSPSSQGRALGDVVGRGGGLSVPLSIEVSPSLSPRCPWGASSRSVSSSGRTPRPPRAPSSGGLPAGPGQGCPSGPCCARPASPQCVCDTRPWFTPQSLARQARAVDGDDQLLTRVPPALAPDTQVLLRQSHEITRLPGALRRLPNLTEPDLSQSRLASLPSLLTLHLEEKQLGELPEGGLRGLVALEELYLDHNRLLSVAPSALAGLARLHRNGNRLRAVGPRWFLPLPRLELHVLGESPIPRLELGGFRPLGRLRSSLLAGMGLRDLPAEAFQGLAELESLSLFRSRLARVPAAALRRPPLLKCLDLKKNPIRELRAGDFRGTPRLEELSLGALEELTGAAEGAFAGLPQLAKLDLNRHPRLAYLPPAALRGAPALRTLLATDGALGLLPGRLLASLPSLAALSLRGNLLRCDCPAAWLGLARLRWVDPGATLSPSCPWRSPGWGWPGGTLELVGVGLAHAGQYTCVAQNEAGSGSRALALEVLLGSQQVNLTHPQLATCYEICMTLRATETPTLATVASPPATTASTLATAIATASSRVPAALATASFATATATSLATGPSLATAASSLATVSAAATAASSRATEDFSLTTASAPAAPGTQRACLNVTRAGLGLAGRGPGGAALAAVTGSLLVALCTVMLARYAGRRLRELGYRAALEPYRQPPATLLLS
ncbi:uncharacterized protein LOC141976463 [Natator depressus]|uniref:uncharacterized protein LOC141976463 n=1 Tax=Natator depressus TaxID=27790 RepID=UPI003EBA1B72